MPRGLDAALSRLGPEASLQLAVVDWLGVVAPWGNPRAPFRWLALRNESPRSAVGRMVEIRLGLVPGAADLLVWWDAPIALPYGAIAIGGRFDQGVGFLELKAPKGRQTANQRTFENRCRPARYRVCRSLEDVQGALRDWGAWLGRGNE